jgi:hypothetical protein
MLTWRSPSRSCSPGEARQDLAHLVKPVKILLTWRSPCGTDLSCASSSTARCGFLLRSVLFAARPSTIRIPCLRSPLRCKGLEIKPKCIAESDEPHRHENKRTAVRTNELFASPPVTSDVISKTDEPQQLKQAGQVSSVKHVIANGPRRHRQDEPNQPRQADHRQWPRTSSPRRTSCSCSGKRAIANGLGRHHHLRPRTSSPRRTSRSS